jgi:hypothetical protein
MRKQKLWRVRVYRKVEEWVTIKADTALQAEELAITLPFVLSVFGKSAMPGNKAVDSLSAVAMVEEEEE